MAAATAAFVVTLSGITSANALTPELPINSDSYVVIDAASGQVLVEKNKDKRKAPASITKIMTLALALTDCNMDEAVTVSKDAVTSIEPGSTHIALVPGEVITMRDAIMGTQLISANDAANVVAEHAAGSMDNFVRQMNQKVEELGLHHSHFENSNGLDAAEHYVTAYDMAQITRYALSVPGFREVFSSTEYQMPPTNIKARNWKFYAQDAIMFPENKEYYEGIEGSKLGYTHNANHTLVALAKRGNMELIVVALDSKGGSAKYNDAKTLLDYCFERYETMTLNGKELKSAQIPIASVESPIGMASVFSKAEHTFVVPLGTPKSSLEIRYDLPQVYKSERQVNPSFSVYTQDGQLVYTAPLTYEILPVDRTVNAVPTARLPKNAYLNDLMLVAVKCLLVVLVVFAIVFVAMRSAIMIRYSVRHRAVLKRKQEVLRRQQGALQRRNAALQAAYSAPVEEGRPIPDNVTHIYPNQNPMVNKPPVQRKKGSQK